MLIEKGPTWLSSLVPKRVVRGSVDHPLRHSKCRCGGLLHSHLRLLFTLQALPKAVRVAYEFEDVSPMGEAIQQG